MFSSIALSLNRESIHSNCKSNCRFKFSNSRCIFCKFPVLLSIIFAIPARYYESENAQIIVKRSIKHLGYGPINIAIGILKGIPILGTCIYFNQYR